MRMKEKEQKIERENVFQAGVTSSRAIEISRHGGFLIVSEGRLAWL